MFEQGDVEAGELKAEWKAKGLRVLRPLEGSEEMTRCFEQSCAHIARALSDGQ